ncbi:Phosphoglycolate phosphatase [compost metagenome]
MLFNMIRYVLFDFDGTLVDSKDAVVIAFNRIAGKYHFKTIKPEELDYINGLSMLDRFLYLKVPLYRLPFLRKEMLAIYQEQIRDVPLIPGMAALLDTLRGSGLRIGILSSNDPCIIKDVMELNGIAAPDDIYCSGKIFGKDRVFRKFLREQKLHNDEVLYICDEQRDITACNKAGIKPVWVSWGFEVAGVIEGDAALAMAHTPDELLAVIQQRC